METIGSASSNRYVPVNSLSQALLGDIPAPFATQHVSLDGTMTIVALEHEADPETVPDDVNHWRIIAERAIVPEAGVSINKNCTIEAHTIVQACSQAGGCPPADWNVSGGQPPPKPATPGKPGGTYPEAPGTKGSNNGGGAKGANGALVSWLGFACVGSFTIESNGGQGQDGGDGGPGGDGGVGQHGPNGCNRKVKDGTHNFHYECVQGRPGTSGGRAGDGGDGVDAGPGGDAGQITVQIMSRGTHIASTSSTGGNPGTPGTRGSPGNPGAGGGGGDMTRESHSGTHGQYTSCDVVGRFPDGGWGGTGNQGGDGKPAGSGKSTTPVTAGSVTLDALRVPDPQRFAAYQLSMRNAQNTAFQKPAQARSTLAWLRMMTPHTNAAGFGAHWTAMHRRAALLLRRLDRARDPFVIDEAPLQPSSEKTQLLSQALAVGLEAETLFRSYVTTTVTNERFDRDAFVRLADGIVTTLRATVAHYDDVAKGESDALIAAGRALDEKHTLAQAAVKAMKPGDPVGATANALMDAITQNGEAWRTYAARRPEADGDDLDHLMELADTPSETPDWTQVTVAVEAYEDATETHPDVVGAPDAYRALAAFVSAARDAHDAYERTVSAIEERDWTAAVADQLAGQLDEARSAAPAWADANHPPFRTLVYAAYEDLRLYAARLFAQIDPDGFNANGHKLGDTFAGMNTIRGLSPLVS